LIGVIITVLALLFVYGQVARPMAALARSVQTAQAGKPVAVQGPAEVAGLGAEINALIESLKREGTGRERAEETYARLFEGSPLPMTVTDVETGKIIETNEAAQKAF